MVGILAHLTLVDLVDLVAAVVEEVLPQEVLEIHLQHHQHKATVAELLHPHQAGQEVAAAVQVLQVQMDQVRLEELVALELPHRLMEQYMQVAVVAAAKLALLVAPVDLVVEVMVGAVADQTELMALRIKVAVVAVAVITPAAAMVGRELYY